MLIFLILEACAAFYAIAYLCNCIRKRRGLASTGAAILSCFALLMGVLLFVFI